MFEKESKLWAIKELGNGYVDDIDNHSKTFQKGAEFGYNKANEWYYVKDGDLPNTELGMAEVTVAYINVYENPCRRDCCFDGINFVQEVNK